MDQPGPGHRFRTLSRSDRPAESPTAAPGNTEDNSDEALPEPSNSTVKSLSLFSVQTLFLLPFLLGSTLVLTAVRSPVSPWLFLLGAAGMFAGMLFLTELSQADRVFRLAMFAALLTRLCFLLLYPASVDIDRYIWEGAIQHQGLNPFLVTPNDPATLPFRDEVWEKASFKDSTTIYWPFAQLLFLLTTSVSEQPLMMKVMISLFDLATLAILLRIAPQHQGHRRFVLLYALNPLVLIFACGLGHIDTVAATLMLAAVACSGNERWKSAACAFLACAVMTKVYAVVLLPFILKKTGWKGGLSLFAPLPLMFLYPADFSSYMAKPVSFAREYAFNGLFHTILHNLCGLSVDATLIVLAILLALSVVAILIAVPSLPQAALHVTGIMLLCLPTMHPWYLLLTTPFIALEPRKSWLTLHLTVIPLIFFFNPDISPTFFHDPHLLLALEFLPFIAAAFWEAASHYRSARRER